jgi:universal stress protein E
MEPVRSILVALENEGDSAGAVTRAVMLARRFNARIELFLCDAERAFELQHQYDQACTDLVRQSFLAESRAAMQRSWTELDVNDIPVSMDAVCESPLYDAIRRKVEASQPDLVIRGIGGRECTFSIADSDLVRTCPTPLLLTRGKSWRAKPAIAAAVDISGVETPDLTRSILLAADLMAATCGASLEVLYALRTDRASSDAAQSRAQLASRAAAANVHPGEVHIVAGDPATVVPQFVARQRYEMLVLGALTHRKTTTALVGTLTGRLVETLDCDLLLVKPRV